jgi:hypothetical protein
MNKQGLSSVIKAFHMAMDAIHRLSIEEVRDFPYYCDLNRLMIYKH